MLDGLDANKRLLVYLVINVIVSALTTLLVITVWSNLALSAGPPIGGASTPSADSSQQVGQVRIATVIGAGNLANERVAIEHVGEQDISLAGWRLRDANGNEYRFPALVLHPGARVNVYTGAGTDSSTDLYWGLSVAVWTSGERLELLDGGNQRQATYIVP